MKRTNGTIMATPAKPATPAVTDNTPTTPTPAEVVETPQTGQTVQLTAIEAEMLKDADLVKADADAVRANVDKAREVTETLAPVVLPFTVVCRNVGILDNAEKMDNPAIGATQAALDTLGISANVVEALERVQIIASSLQTPDLSILDNADVNATAAAMRNALENTRYVQVSDMVRTTATAALQHHAASRSQLREWLNKSGRAVPSNTGTKGASGQNGANSLKQTDKVSNLIGTDIQYHCDNCNTIGYSGGTTLSGVYYAIRDHYCTCRNEPQSAHAGSSPTYQGIKAGVNKVVTGANQENVPGGYVSRATAA